MIFFFPPTIEVFWIVFKKRCSCCFHLVIRVDFHVAVRGSGGQSSEVRGSGRRQGGDGGVVQATKFPDSPGRMTLKMADF